MVCFAALQNLNPVNPAAVPVGIEDDITDLPDAETAVQEMFEGVENQIEQMVGGAEC